jgi:hypothetical protein
MASSTATEIADALERAVQEFRTGVKYEPVAIPFEKDARNPETKREFFAHVSGRDHLYSLLKRQYEVEQNQNEALPDDTVLQEFMDMTPEYFYNTRVPASDEEDIDFRSLLRCYVAMLYYTDSEITIERPKRPANQEEAEFFDEEAYDRFDDAPLRAQLVRKAHVREWQMFFADRYRYLGDLKNAYKQTPPMKLEQWKDYCKKERERQKAEKDENDEKDERARVMREQKYLKEAEDRAELAREREREWEAQTQRIRASRQNKPPTGPLSAKEFKRHQKAYHSYPNLSVYKRPRACEICERQHEYMRQLAAAPAAAAAQAPRAAHPSAACDKCDRSFFEKQAVVGVECQSTHSTSATSEQPPQPLPPLPYAPPQRQEQNNESCDKCGDRWGGVCLCDME